MAKRLLYLEDLYDFYFNRYKRSTHFSAEKSGEPLVVQVCGKATFDEADKDKEGLLPVHLQSCHTDLNVNGSNIPEEVMKAALPSFSNRPILGYIHKVVTDENPDGQWEFYSHNMHEENDEIVYDEYPIGIIPESCNAKLVYDEDKKKTYCEVDGYIYEEYSKAAEILTREKECFVSVELSIRELSYDAKQKYLNIEDFFFSGVTILGKTPDGEAVNPGMAGSNIKLSDFSMKNNSMFEYYEAAIAEMQERLTNLESTCFNIEKENTKGGTELKKENFEEEVTATEEEVTETSEEEVTTTEEESEETVVETSEEEQVNKTTETEEESESFESMTRTFEISHEDIRYAIYNLLASYEESDNEWYYISNVYDSYFVYETWDGGKIYGQKYEVDGDNITFDGERYTLRKEYLTESEYVELQNMRANYAELKAFKENVEKNELHAKREELINSEKFAILSQKDKDGKFVNKDFESLVAEMDNYSLADLETKIKIMHSDFVAANSSFVSTIKDVEKPEVKLFANVNKKTKAKKRYGNLFDK